MLSDLLQYENKNNVFILGSGYSINTIKPKTWNKLKKHTTIAFNWFCFHDFEPSIYIVREQANIKQRRNKEETVQNFINKLKSYNDTSIIVSDVSHHSPHAYRYKNNDFIKEKNATILKDIKYRKKVLPRRLVDTLTKNAFSSNSCFHGDEKTACSLVNALHIAISLNPKNIVLLGVDLCDSKYFWMGKEQTRHTVKKKGQTFRSKHATHNKIIYLMNSLKRTNYNFISGSKKSALNKTIKYKEIDDLI
jgi:hypothetical protein